MCSTPANLSISIISDDYGSYSLKDMICPSFENEGECDVLINGRLVRAGASFGINVPGYAIQNDVSIKFLNTSGQKKVLYVSYLKEIKI